MRRGLPGVPDGYVVHRVGDTSLVFDRGAAPDLVRLRLADPAVRREWFARAPKRGRGAVPAVEVRPGLDMLLRRYRHGGLLAHLTRSLFLGPGRALSELRVTAEAESRGAPVPHVLCLILWPVAGPLWSAVIGTREEPRAHDLLEVARATRDPAEREALAREVGVSIRRLHDAGVDHRDLQLRNILAVERDGQRRIVVVDLDRALHHPRRPLSIRRRAENLGRLMRSAVKNGLWQSRVGQPEVDAFVEGYTGDDASLGARLRRWVPRERLKLQLHQLGYRLAGTGAGG